VLALQSIAQDVGADRALLFSESGFQSGAIRACKNTNVVLTNFDDFRASAGDELAASTIIKMMREVEILHSKVKPLWLSQSGRIAPVPGADLDELIGIDGAILFFKLAFPKALAAAYPISYPAISNCETITSSDVASFLRNAGRSLSEARELVAKFESAYQRATGAVPERVNGFSVAVDELVQSASDALFAGEVSEDRFEHLRFDALGKMKAVGRAIEGLHTSDVVQVRDQILRIKQLLVDTVYLYLTLPTIPRERWDATVAALDTEVAALKRMAREA
jgi:hypothetical protein